MDPFDKAVIYNWAKTLTAKHDSPGLVKNRDQYKSLNFIQTLLSARAPVNPGAPNTLGFNILEGLLDPLEPKGFSHFIDQSLFGDAPHEMPDLPDIQPESVPFIPEQTITGNSLDKSHLGLTLEKTAGYAVSLKTLRYDYTDDFSQDMEWNREAIQNLARIKPSPKIEHLINEVMAGQVVDDTISNLTTAPEIAKLILFLRMKRKVTANILYSIILRIGKKFGVITNSSSSNDISFSENLFNFLKLYFFSDRNGGFNIETSNLGPLKDIISVLIKLNPEERLLVVESLVVFFKIQNEYPVTVILQKNDTMSIFGRETATVTFATKKMKIIEKVDESNHATHFSANEHLALDYQEKLDRGK